MTHFRGRIAIKVRALAKYRAPLYDALAGSCEGVFVAAGAPRAHETLATADTLERASYRPLRNRYFLQGALTSYWQSDALAWVEEVEPDVLFVEANPRCLDTHVLRALTRRKGIPLIGWGLGMLSLASGFEAVRSAFRSRFVRNFDAMITYSTRAADEYVAAGLPRSAVYVAHNAVSPRPVHALPSRASTQTLEATRILFVGRLIEWKRVDDLIRACAAAFPTAQPELVIVGDGPMRSDYERLAHTTYPRTSFLGEQHGRALARIFAAADLFVLPNRGGLAIQEAMAYGLPVIAADADGTEIDLVRETNGWLIPACDVHSLANAMRDALADLPRLRAMGAQSYRIIAEEINLERLIESILNAATAVTMARRERAARAAG